MLSVKRVLQLFWMALCVAYWALLPQFYLVYNEGNRYSLSWTHASHLVILAGILVVGVVFLIGLALALGIARHWAMLDKPIRVAIGGVVGVIFIRTIFSLVDKGELLAPGWQSLLDASPVKVGFYLLPFVGSAWSPKSFRMIARILSVGLMVLLAMFLVVPLFWNTYGWDDRELPPAKSEWLASTNSIYIFLFDGWSYPRTFSGSNLSERMPHLSALLNHADLYEQAQSCGPGTFISVPRFLHQNDPQMQKLSYDEVRQMAQRNLFGQHRFKSIFDLSSHHCKTVLGLYFHYPSSIGDRVDYCGRYNVHSDNLRYMDDFLSLLSSQIQFVKHFGIPLREGPARWTLDSDIGRMQLMARDRILDMLEQLPPMAISYFHIPFPHNPYQFRPDGSIRDPVLIDSESRSDVAGYMDNLGYTDLLVGDIVETMKRRGVYDSALLVFFSDHTWGQDPEQPCPTDYKAIQEADLEEWHFSRHVPLIIKHPDQSVARTFSQSVSCWDLYQLFSQYLAQPSETMDFEWWSREDLPSGQRVVN